MRILAALAVFALLQQPPPVPPQPVPAAPAEPQPPAQPKAPQAQPAGPHRVVLVNREEFSGEVLEYRREGVLLMKEGPKSRALPVEEIARIYFEAAPSVAQEAGEKLRLQQGGLLTGRNLVFADGGFAVETAAGAFAVARADVKSVSFAPLDGNIPELKEEKKDTILWKAKGDEKSDFKVAYGDLVSATAEAVTLRDEKGQNVDVPRGEARVLYLYQEPKTRPDMPTGWFAKLQFKNGDKIVGILRAIEKESVVVFSHFLGTVSARKSLLHSVGFVQYARMSVGNILVCEQNGVRELDRAGKEIWRYQVNVSYPWAARKLENGNVLVANTNYNQILEIRPKEKAGGDVVWQLDNVNYPYDAQRLDNGNTLVAEYYANRVSEYEPKNKSIVWQTSKCNYPISVQRLDNGHTLIASTYQVIELNEKQEEKWRGPSGLRPWRAERLDNGNTLIVDQQRGQVVEVDVKNREVWRKDGLSRPTAAIRLDDGNTLILEQGKHQILEIDPAGKQVGTITGLNYPLHISTY